MQVSDIIIRRLWVVRRLSLTVSAYAFARFVGGGGFFALMKLHQLIEIVSWVALVK